MHDIFGGGAYAVPMTAPGVYTDDPEVSEAFAVKVEGRPTRESKVLYGPVDAASGQPKYRYIFSRSKEDEEHDVVVVYQEYGGVSEGKPVWVTEDKGSGISTHGARQHNVAHPEDFFYRINDNGAVTELLPISDQDIAAHPELRDHQKGYNVSSAQALRLMGLEYEGKLDARKAKFKQDIEEAQQKQKEEQDKLQKEAEQQELREKARQSRAA